MGWLKRFLESRRTKRPPPAGCPEYLTGFVDEFIVRHPWASMGDWRKFAKELCLRGWAHGYVMGWEAGRLDVPPPAPTTTRVVVDPLAGADLSKPVPVQDPDHPMHVVFINEDGVKVVDR